ncbi:hypothetical protein ACQP1K_17630 [Sphaerimonospora sp. CA-214678]|uniref:hypothetical protein n=1 Tax=Sphaerimonospora sp. CA-214678 TaxID=3240029 RepID=UPI003D935BE6
MGVYSGLEAEYQVRSGVVYVRNPEDREQRCTQVSLARWSRFLASVKAGQFTPQQEGDVVTITIDDQSHATVTPLPSFVVTNRRTWKLFVKAVERGEFDHLGNQRTGQ